jgi:hypothetical protein
MAGQVAGDAVRSTVVDYLGASTLRRRVLSGSTWALGGKFGAATIGLLTNGVLMRLLTKQASIPSSKHSASSRAT